MTRNQSMHMRVSTLALAVAMVVGPSPLAAQSFQADGSFTHGTGTISTPDNATTNISVTSSQAVIDWSPFADGGTSGQEIIFQPGLTTTTFSGDADFAVLNRIDVDDMTRIIRMDGTINSYVNGSTGGSIYFYSPSGFILGATSLINVGSLVLTSLPITVDGNGNFITNGTVVFGSAPDPFGNAVNSAAEIETHSLTQIGAPNEGSYVAMVAPRVEHHGEIDVNGAAALVGAEAATITFRPSGLFDIQIDVGTTDPQGVAVYGDITGEASSGVGDNHRIYLAAVPKNTALTMLISNGAELGFEVAGAADVVGNTVVLSAGHDVFFGSSEFQESAASGAAANALVYNSSFTSAFSATASGNIDVTAAAAGSTQFAGNASLRSSGGYVQVESLGSDSLLSVAGNLGIVTDRYGASDGESVTAGQAAVYAQAGGQLSVTGNVNVSANGYGGDSFTQGIDAGHGTGGQVLIQAESNSSLSIGGSIFVTADGYGGQPGTAGVDAGNGDGGSVFIGTFGSDASLGVTGSTYASANGFGGSGDGSGNECFDCDGLGGTGTGGSINVGTNSGTGSTAFFGGAVELDAEGLGGRSALAGSTSGAGEGGFVFVVAQGGTQIEGYGLAFGSDLVISAVGSGGESYTAGIRAGDGEGGFAQVSAFPDSSLGIFGDLEMDAGGNGGFNDFGVDGGNGQGGFVYVTADGGNAFLNVEGTADLAADGEASVANSDCTVCGGIGGAGYGGEVHVLSSGGVATGNFINFASSLDLSAEGNGGLGATGVAGAGEGGDASINVTADLSVTIGGALTIEADGYGGYGINGNGGGAGTGGTAAIYGNGGDLDVNGTTLLAAGGSGGNTGVGGGGTAGDGSGGLAEIYAASGTLDFVGTVTLEAGAQGGDSPGGIGGNATGGRARVGTDGGTIHILGDLNMDGGAIGGDGDTGGNAVALATDPGDELQPSAVGVYTGSGGSIDVDGSAILIAEASGGNGANGNGGTAEAGEVDVVGYFGDISLGTLAVSVNAYGGAGGNGGNGGNATAGNVDVAFGYEGAAVGGTITLGSAFITADAFGGAGGAGLDANSGGDGGNGGSGTGGNVIFAGSAAGGTLSSGAATITARGEGGAGGAGGNGDTGAGGNGGAGGLGQGGFIQTGTVSAELAPGSGGGASYATLYLDSSGFGGAGGDGGTGGGGTGTGGDGGAATGGEAYLLARGVPVTATDVQLFASATGGDGGSGAAAGNGGNATTGFVAVEAKERVGHSTERGSLEADSITASAIAVGGSGAVNGTSTLADGSYFRLLNGDADIGTLSFVLGGDAIDATFGPSLVSVRDGTAAIGTFSFVTTGELALDASNGTMTSNAITLSAATFVEDNFNPLPTAPGSYVADGFDISTGGDFITNATLDSASDLAIIAPGDIAVADIVADGSVQLEAQGATLAAGDIIAGGFVDLAAPTSVTTGDISAVQQILIQSDTITGGDMTAGGFIDLFAGGLATITVGDLSGAGIYLMSIGDITTGTIDSTLDVELTSFDGAITTLDVTAATDVTIAAAGTVETGDIDASGTVDVTGGALDLGAVSGSVIDLASTTGDLSTGDLLAFSSLSVLSAADFLFGSITAPLVDLNAPGSIIGGFIDSESDIFATAGLDILVGELTAGGFDGETFLLGNILLNAGGDIETGAATAAGFIEMFAGGGILVTGDLAALTLIDLEALGSIGFENASAEGIDLESGGAITGGNITAESYAIGEALGAITLGDITVGPELPPAGDFSVGFASATSITVGDVSGADRVGFATLGDLTAGDLSATNLIMTLVGGDITVGSMTTSAPGGEVYMADAQMYIDAGGTQDEFDAALVLAEEPLATGGSITINGPVSTGRFRAAAGSDLSTGAIAADSIEVEAGGLATLNGTWQAPAVTLRSADIAIGESGGIDAGAEGSIILMSSASGGVLLGDGLTGEGYALSNAEFGRLSAGELAIVSGGVAGADGDMLIGDLSITGPAAGSTIESASGGVTFMALNEAGTELDGTIRIVGEVQATGFGSDNYLAFHAQNFQLDAETGLLSIEGAPGTLGGTLFLEAANIHVASGDILDQLALDPQYEGYQDDLNAPAAVPRPEGVVRAETVEIAFVPAELNTLYVQNTGTAELPAGFLISDLNLGDDGETGLPAGSVDLIINGQIVTADGTLTGIDVRDLLVEGRDLSPFTENSTINNCLLDGPCGSPGGSDDLPVTPVPGIQTEIRLITENLLPPPEFGNEDFIDDNDEATDEGASSPIEPPHPLFDTSALGAKGDVDEPVSGSGNPALMETPPPSDNREKQP